MTDPKEAAIQRLANDMGVWWMSTHASMTFSELCEGVARIAIEQGVVPVWREIEISCTEPHLEIPWAAVCPAYAEGEKP